MKISNACIFRLEAEINHIQRAMKGGDTMKTAPILTARDRAALTNAARTLSRIVGELDGDAPAPRRKRRKAKPKPVPVAATAKPSRRRSLRDVPEPA